LRRNAKRDVNEGEIVAGLRKVGASVNRINEEDLPDLLVGFRGVNYLIEIKPPSGPRGGVSGKVLTPGQLRWARDWRGQIGMARTLDEALHIIKAIR